MLKRRVASALDRLVGSAVARRVEPSLDAVRLAVGVNESRLAQLLPEPARLRDTEFTVFSQWGEDGIIQHLIRRTSPPETFVEIGVGDYTESNTRFLVLKDNWRGAILNGGTAHQEMLVRTGMAWKYGVTAVSAFVTAENVDELIAGTGLTGDLGLLSVDIDGVDYWVLRAITVVRPWIVVVEHNSVFGPDAAVTVPYDPAFVASEAHYTGQYFGASLSAFHHWARGAGYRLVGVGSSGVNAYFVRDDVAADLWDLTPAEAYVRSRFRTARDRTGALAYTGDDHQALLASMRDLPLHDLRAGEQRSVGAVFGP